MEIFAHRGFWLEKEEQNTLISFERAFMRGQSVELDIWKEGTQGELLVGHDVGVPACKFQNVLDLWRKYPNRMLAINIKCDGLAKNLGNMMKKDLEENSDNFFAFDMSTPERFIFEKLNFPIAYRVSEFEPYSLVRGEDKIWLDSFKSDWWLDLDLTSLESLLKKSIVVSPELHGRNAIEALKQIEKFETFGVCLDSLRYFNEQ